MTYTGYENAKAAKASLEATVKRLGAVMQSYPIDPMGLTPDAIKATAQWKADRLAFDRAYAQLRKLNAWFVKEYKTELRAERRARRSV